MRTSTSSSWRIAFCAAAIAAVYVLMRIPGISLPLDRDEGIFGYIGQVVNRGGLPYRDALDHKPPVAFYINALALHFVPPTPAGIHSFLLLYNFLTLIGLFFLGKMLFRSVPAGLCCAFAFAVFSASPAIHGFTASTEMYALLPTTLSLLLAVPGVRLTGLKAATLTVMSGIAGAAACWTKQTAFTSVLFVFLYVCIAPPRGPGSFARGARWLAGALLFSGAVALYFYESGVFESFIYWCFTYEMAYASVPFGQTLDTLRERLSEIGRGDFILPAAGLTIAILGLARKPHREYFLAGFLLLSFLGTLPGYTYPHYFVQIAPAVALAGGYALFLVLELVPGPGLKVLAAMGCCALILADSVLMNRQYFLEANPARISKFYFGNNPFPQAVDTASFIAGHTSENDEVLVLGSEPEILFYARRRSSTPFLMIYPLTSVHGRYQEFEKKMWADVQAARPKYILAAVGIPSSVAWDESADLQIVRNTCGLIGQSYARVRRFPVSGSQDLSDQARTCLSATAASIDVYKRIAE